MIKRALIPTIAAALLFTGAGCVSFSAGDVGGTGDGGVFKTSDKGDNWAQRSAIATAGAPKSIGGVSVVSMTQDPQDPNAVYIGTSNNGMFYTYDGGESWHQPVQLRRGKISSVSVSSKNKCQIYVTAENKILKSTDCSRSFSTTYLDSRTDKVMTVVLVDFFDPQIIWIGNDSGDVLKSTDSGQSWSPVTNFKSAVEKMAFHADDSRRLYAATKSSGVWRTDDGGANWLNLREGYKDFKSSHDFLDMAVGISDPAVIVIATKYGLLRSTDRGDTWEDIELLTPSGSTVIYSVAMDPRDANNIYYGTSTTFYRSPNGGMNWVPKKLPTTRAATAMLVDMADSNVLYMGVTRIKN